MTVNQFVQTLPWWWNNLKLFSFGLAIIIFITILCWEIFFSIEYGDSDFIFESIPVTALLSGFITLLIVLGIGTIFPVTKSQIEYARATQTEVVSSRSIDLESASSAGYTDTNIQGSVFYISGSTTDTTSYRFITKSGDNYQIRTLSDMFGNDINKNDIYIHQSNDQKPHIQIEKHKYADKRMADIVDFYTNYDSKWTTYTFYVPENSITQKFDFK